MPELRICIDVPDLDAAVAFYTRALGFTVRRRLGGDWAELSGAGCPLDLLRTEAGAAASPATDARRTFERHWTPLHLDVAVEDVEQAVARAEAAGARLEAPIARRPWGRLALLSDPFGHGFCFLQFQGRGYDEVLAPAAG